MSGTQENNSNGAGPSSVPPKCIGLDLGTSNSSFALDGIVINNPQTGTPEFPSRVDWGGNTIQFTKRLLGLGPKDASAEIERLGIRVEFAMDENGNPKTDHKGEKGVALYSVTLGDETLEVTAEFFMAVALLPLFETMKKHVGDQQVKICVGHPVDFHDLNKKRIENIVLTLSGHVKINVCQVLSIPEPICAAYSRLQDESLKTLLEKEDFIDVIVIDVGCGTSDYCVVRIRGTQVEVLDTDGELAGGADITNLIAKVIKEHDKEKQLTDDEYLEYAEKFKRMIQSNQKRWSLHDMGFKRIKCTFKRERLISSKKSGVLDDLRASFNNSVRTLAEKAGVASKQVIMVGGGTNFVYWEDGLKNHGFKVQQEPYGICRGAAAYISGHTVPIVEYPVPKSTGTATIGTTTDRKAHAFRKENLTPEIAIRAGEIVKEGMTRTISIFFPTSKDEYLLRVPIVQVRYVTIRGERKEKIDYIGEITIEPTKDMFKKEFQVVFQMTAHMSLRVVAVFKGKEIGEFVVPFLVQQNDEDKETGGVVSSLKENLDAYLEWKKKDEESDEEDSSSDEEEEKTPSDNEEPVEKPPQLPVEEEEPAENPSKRPLEEERLSSDEEEPAENSSKRPRKEEKEPSDEEEPAENDAEVGPAMAA